jgi:hypothetical protein
MMNAPSANRGNSPRALVLGMALAALCVTGTAGATSVCRWVDAAGRTQVADQVPDAYRAVAQCSDSRMYELTPQQREEATQRAQQAAALASAGAASSPGSAPAGPSDPARPEPVVKRPVEAVTEATDCTTWWRLFDESVACFGPFRTTRGATKVEAFDHCNAIASPEPACGLRRR